MGCPLLMYFCSNNINMGKVFLLLAGSLLIGFSGIAGTDSPHDKGFRFNFHIGMTGGYTVFLLK